MTTPDDPIRPEGSDEVFSEFTGSTRSGIPVLIFAIVVLLVGAGGLVLSIIAESVVGLVLSLAAIVIASFVLAGLYMVRQNRAAVLTLFGDYKGTDSVAGLRWANPFYAKEKVSLRVRNFNTSMSKVNDSNGNPVMIAAVVVWRVTDTARATFGVDDFEDYVEIQSESALRQSARSYPYDSFGDDSDADITLIGDTGEVNGHLLSELQERVDDAGVEILESRITDLSYAPEIAEAMLRRQQASAIVAARAKIVEGAVLMVQDAIERLESGSDGPAIELDNDRKATFASNLMTVITSDAPTSPVVNVGTLNR